MERGKMIVNWQRYEKLNKKPFEEMTEEEKEFYKFMYHVEEYKSGLDG